MIHRHFLSLFMSCSLTLLASSPCEGVVRTWDAGGDGVSWEDNWNWSGDAANPSGLQPFAGDDAVVPFGSPEISFVEAVATLLVFPAARIDLNGALSVHAGVANEGLITIADDGQFFVNTGVLGGAGSVVLADSTGTPATVTAAVAPNPCCVTLAATQTIRGEGAVAGQWIHNGLIRAEETTGDASAVLRILDSMTNHGMIRSSATGSVDLRAMITNGATGKIIADTRPITLGAASITGGALDAVNGGRFVFASNPVTLTNVTVNTDFDVLTTNGTLTVAGPGITNNSTITLDNLGAAESRIVLADGSSLGGTGTVVLNRAGNGTRINGGSFTHGANHTIRGVGLIQATFVNNGSILAEPRNGTLLRIVSNITNNHLIQANAGASLRLESGGAITQSAAGRIRAANGGVVELLTAQVTGGRLESDGTGVIVATNNSLLTDVASSSNLQLPVANGLRIAGSSFVNDGVLTVNPTGAAGFIPTLLTFDSSLTLQGTGQMVLNQTGNNARIGTAGGNKIVTQALGHTIRGKGVLSDGTYVNHGRLEGFSASEPLAIIANLRGDGVLKDVSFAGAFTQFTHTVADEGTTATVSLEGTYNLGRNGTIRVDLGGTTAGTGYDQLNSTGPITLSSTVTRLEASIIRGFVPAAGDQFTVLTTTDTLTGTFRDVILPTLIPSFSLSWKPVQYNGRSVILEVLSVTPFVADGDFNNDGIYNCLDVDALTREIVSQGNGPLYDLTGDGTVNQADLNSWLAEAGMVNLPSGNPYLLGDANLDGVVDGSDFGVWNSNKFTTVAAWCSGDFSADGVVDGSDFGIWNANKFRSADGASAVPEPGAIAFWPMVIIFVRRIAKTGVAGAKSRVQPGKSAL